MFSRFGPRPLANNKPVSFCALALSPAEPVNPLTLNTRSRTRRHEDLFLLLASLTSSCSSEGLRSLATRSRHFADTRLVSSAGREGFDRDSLRVVPDASYQKVEHYSSRVVPE